MSNSLRAHPNPPSLIDPFSSNRTLVGFKSQWIIPWLCRCCVAASRSRPRSCTLSIGKHRSCWSKLFKSPPTQYSRMSHRWLCVSYLRAGGFVEYGSVGWGGVFQTVCASATRTVMNEKLRQCHVTQGRFSQTHEKSNYLFATSRDVSCTIAETKQN